MSRTLRRWKEKLDYLQEQLAILSDPAQKFTVEKQIEDAQSRIAELELSAHGSPGVWGLRWPYVVGSLLLVALLAVGAFYLYRELQASAAKTLTAAGGFPVFEKPEQDSEIVSWVKAGETFDLVQSEGSKNWAFVRHREKQGWVAAQDMSFVAPIKVATGLGFRGSYWQLFFTSPKPKTGPLSALGIDARFAQAIKQSRKSLDIAIYELSSRIVTDAILDAQSRDVSIRIVTDERSLDQKGSTFREVMQRGIPVVAKKKGSGLMHSKFSIIDNATVWTGSWNYSESGTYANNENVIALDSPEIARVFATKFERLYADGAERSKHPSETSQLRYGVRTFFAPEDPTLETLASTLSGAKRSIRFMTFLLSVDGLADVLRKQAANGVRVQGITERSLVRTSKVTRELLEADSPNLEIRVDANPRYLRHNCVIVDDQVVLLGSMNMSRVGATRNDENLILVPDSVLASKFVEEFERLWKVAGKLPPKEISSTDSEETEPEPPKAPVSASTPSR